jgi:hypothetical protein
MKYILLMNTMKANCEPLQGWSKKDFQAHCAYLIAMHKELCDSGEMVTTEGLTFPDQARLVRADKDGLPMTDGVFPEGKEFLASYSIIDVDSPERAYAIAARVSAAPGPDGKPLNMPIEVRQVMTRPPAEVS